MSEKAKLVPKRRLKEFQTAGEWEQRKLGDNSEIMAGGTPSTQIESYWMPKEIPWLSSGEVHKKRITYTDNMISKNGLENSSARWIKENSVLVALAGQGKTRGTVAINLIPLTTNQSIAAIVLNKELHYEFVFQNLANRYDELRTLSSADGSRGGLNKQILSELNVRTPQFEEQQRIGQFFQNLDNLITLHQRKLEKMKALKSAYLSVMFPTEGEQEPKQRFAGFTGAWKQRKLGDYAKFRRGSFPQPYGKSEWYDGEGAMPFVQVVDVSNNLRLIEDTKQKISKMAQPMSIFVPKGKVLVTLQGSIGRVAITQYETFVDRTILIFEDFSECTDEYFWAYLIQNKFDIEKKIAPGGTIKTITKEALSGFSIKLPQIKEQEQIGKFLRNFDNLITLQQRKLEKLQNIKKAYLNEMFL